jgi:hypothetical protein
VGLNIQDPALSSFVTSWMGLDTAGPQTLLANGLFSLLLPRTTVK